MIESSLNKNSLDDKRAQELLKIDKKEKKIEKLEEKKRKINKKISKLRDEIEVARDMMGAYDQQFADKYSGSDK